MRTIVLSLVAGAVLLAGTAFSNDLPESKRNCAACHVLHEMDSGKLLKESITELCSGCHADRVPPAEHVVDIVPKKGSGELPLDKDGKMTCATCHDPHGTAGLKVLLRKGTVELCTDCHDM